MKTLNFSIQINSPKQKIWETLWNDFTYRQWTSAFCEGSHVVSDWKEGSKTLFLDAMGDGMSSVIDKIVPNDLMSFKHLGAVSKGVEQPVDENSGFYGAKESYYLKQVGSSTELIVEVDATEDFETYLQQSFPKSLEKVKEIAEN